MHAMAESVPSAASLLVGATSKEVGLQRQAEFVRNAPIFLMLSRWVC
jgi:hypothetical protein